MRPCLEVGTSSIDWAQLSEFYLKTETESNLRNVVLCNINRKVFLDNDNVQKCNVCPIDGLCMSKKQFTVHSNVVLSEYSSTER
jgi:hypothetical protein